MVDDGSTDGTRARGGDRGAHPLLRQANRGPAAARNAGIRLAEGDASPSWTPTTCGRRASWRSRQRPWPRTRTWTSCRAWSRRWSARRAGPVRARLPALRLRQPGQRAVPPLRLRAGGPVDEWMRFNEDTDSFFRAWQAGAAQALAHGGAVLPEAPGQHDPRAGLGLERHGPDTQEALDRRAERLAAAIAGRARSLTGRLRGLGGHRPPRAWDGRTDERSEDSWQGWRLAQPAAGGAAARGAAARRPGRARLGGMESQSCDLDQVDPGLLPPAAPPIPQPGGPRGQPPRPGPAEGVYRLTWYRNQRLLARLRTCCRPCARPETGASSPCSWARARSACPSTGTPASVRGTRWSCGSPQGRGRQRRPRWRRPAGPGARGWPTARRSSTPRATGASCAGACWPPGRRAGTTARSGSARPRSRFRGSRRGRPAPRTSCSRPAPRAWPGSARRRFTWAADAATLAGDPGVDWDLLLDRAAACGLVLPLAEALGYVRERLDAPVPGAALDRLRGLPVTTADRLNYRLAASPPGERGLALGSWLYYQKWRRSVRRRGFIRTLALAPRFLRRRRPSPPRAGDRGVRANRV